jgi:low affinity Fe/Cu permease
MGGMSRPFFVRFAKKTSHLVGHPLAFLFAVIVILAWVISGPIFGFSDTWQLVINTATTIITFLMVFVIQNTQNRDTAAIHVKLDELVRSIQGAHNAVLDLEELSEGELEQLRRQYEQLAEEARVQLREGRGDTDSPPLPAGESSSPRRSN